MAAPGRGDFSVPGLGGDRLHGQVHLPLFACDDRQRVFLFLCCGSAVFLSWPALAPNLAGQAWPRRLGRGTWKSPEKAVALLNLCMPYAYSGCQFTYGYCLRLGLGMRKDVAKAYARYEVARLLGAQNAPKALDLMKSIVTDDEKTAALALAKSMRNELKPIPRKLGLQVPQAPGPPSPWSTR
jgi:hypothetical protein